MSQSNSTSFNLKETDLYFLVGKALKSCFNLPQNTLFFEVPVGASRADIVYVQTPHPYETILPAGIHLFEVKMRWDNDHKRLKKQLDDYVRAVDYVWVVGVNKPIGLYYPTSGSMVFSTCGCRMSVIKMAERNDKYINICERQDLLSRVAYALRKKYRLVEDMARINPVGEKKILVQEKLSCLDESP